MLLMSIRGSVMVASGFGRVPAETLQLFQQNIADVKNNVLSALPAQADEQLRGFTLEKILATVFRDWQEHGNTFLSPDDVKDLSSFVQMSASLAGNQINAQGRAVFEASLSALLEDWLYNWNTEKQEQRTK